MNKVSKFPKITQKPVLHLATEPKHNSLLLTKDICLNHAFTYTDIPEAFSLHLFILISPP